MPDLTRDADRPPVYDPAIRPIRPATSGLSAPPTASTSRRSTSSRLRSSGYGAVRQRHAGAWRRHQLLGQRRSGTGASRRTRRRRCRCCVGPDAGNGNLLDTIDRRRTNPFNPFGVDARRRRNYDTSIRPPRRRRRAAPLQPEGQHDLRRRDARRQVRCRRPRLVSGTSTASTAATRPSRRCSAISTPTTCSRRSGPVACAAPRGCVPFNIFGGAGSITQAMLDFVGFVQHDSSKQKIVGRHRQHVGQLVRAAGRAARARRRASSIASSRAGSIPIRSSRPASAPTFRRSRPRAATTSRKPMPRSNAPLLADRPFADLLELSGAVRFSDYSTSGSTTTFKAGVNWKPIEDLRLRGILGRRLPRAVDRRVVRHPVALRLRSSTIPARSTAQLPRNFTNDATVRANCIAQGVPPAAATTQPNAQISVITGGNEDLKPETSKSWVLGGVYSPSSCRASRSRPIGTTSRSMARSRRSRRQPTLHNCVLNNDPAACALVTARSTGEHHRNSTACCRTSPASRPRASTSTSPIGPSRPASARSASPGTTPSCATTT